MFNYAQSHFEETVSELISRGVSNESARSIGDSGYFVHPIGSGFSADSELMLMDSFYGTKGSGLFKIGDFVKYSQGQEIVAPERGTAIYRNVQSLKEVTDILNLSRHSKYLKNNMLSFRGQNKEYWVNRAIPNPKVMSHDKKERMIVPSAWRKSVHEGFSLRTKFPSHSIFKQRYADNLIYKGIPNWKTLSDINFKRYGFHSMDDLQSFPDAESQEYYKRYVLHKQSMSNEMPLLEQHYGIDTIGLDISFDVATSLFFATHQFFTKENGKSTFLPIEQGKHSGVLYFFVFRDPIIKSTDWLVKEINIFSHIPPLRPLRQQCGLPSFQYHEIAAAALDLDAVIYLDKDFSISDLPEKEYLFPIKEDDFYMALLEEKIKNPSRWESIVEYEF